MKRITLLLTLSLASLQPLLSQAFHFKSGFDGSTTLHQYELNGNPNPNYADLYGSDNGYDWETDLDDHPNMGNFRIYYEVGDTLKAKASLVPDPVDGTNQVLKFQLDSANVSNISNPKGRVQAVINGNNNLKEFSHRVSLYLDPEIETLRNYGVKITWFTLAEYWNDAVSQPYPFRVTLNLQKPDTAVGSPLFFGAHGQIKTSSGPWSDVWEHVDTTYEAPTGEWLVFETYFREGDSLNGRYRVSVTNSNNNTHSLIDITDFTHHPMDPSPDGVRNFNPMKLYTSGGLIDQMALANADLALYWDDFEIWTDTILLNTHIPFVPSPKIFPNPTSGSCQVHSEMPIKEVHLFNYAGKLERVYTLEEEEMDLSGLEKGIYFAEIFFWDGKREFTRVIRE